jgi:hypothetical protein
LAKALWPRLSLSCSGQERTLLDCRAKDVSSLGSCDLARHGAAVRCARPSKSLCGPLEVAWGQKCYKLSQKMETREQAKAQCGETGNLLAIESQVFCIFKIK